MNVAIIAAAGQGTRLGGGRPKQFLELAGVPIIIHTLNRFEQCDEIQEVVAVLPAEERSEFLSLAGKYGLRKLTRVLTGGATRAESVRRGLESIREATAEIVAVHDGVRPLVSSEEITRTVLAAQRCGAAILAAPVIDTIKEVGDGRVLRTLDRARLQRALTPQCFRYELLRRAFAQSTEVIAAATDESSLVESLGVPVSLVEGDARNIKITRPEDLALAEILLKSSESVESSESSELKRTRQTR